MAVAGGPVIDSVSESLSSIVASGNLKYSAGLATDILRFKMILTLSEKEARISFINIQRAQQDTGLWANDGFSPLGVWFGSRYEQAYTALENKAANIAQCMSLAKT